jgi:hypothetical protein
MLERPLPRHKQLSPLSSVIANCQHPKGRRQPRNLGKSLAACCSHLLCAPSSLRQAHGRIEALRHGRCSTRSQMMGFLFSSQCESGFEMSMTDSRPSRSSAPAISWGGVPRAPLRPRGKGRLGPFPRNNRLAHTPIAISASPSAHSRNWVMRTPAKGARPSVVGGALSAPQSQAHLLAARVGRGRIQTQTAAVFVLKASVELPIPHAAMLPPLPEPSSSTVSLPRSNSRQPRHHWHGIGTLPGSIVPVCARSPSHRPRALSGPFLKLPCSPSSLPIRIV